MCTFVTDHQGRRNRLGKGEANCYMISVRVCPNIDLAIACESHLAIISAKWSKTQNFELCEEKDRSTCLPNLVALCCSPASI